MNKKGGLLTWLIILIFLLVVFALSLNKIKFYLNSDCFEKKAKNVCVEKGYFFSKIGISKSFYFGFECVEEERATEGIFYRFTNEEEEACFNG